MTRFAASTLLLFALGCAKGPPPPTDGATTATDGDCPKDLLAARGKGCTPEGKTCSEGPGAFTHLLMCSRGKWTEMDAPPPPPPPH